MNNCPTRKTLFDNICTLYGIEVLKAPGNRDWSATGEAIEDRRVHIETCPDCQAVEKQSNTLEQIR